MAHDLWCDHGEGKEELLDDLAIGNLSRSDQQALYALLSRMVDLPNAFRPEQVPDYESFSNGDGTYTENWHCPICTHYNTDIRDERNN